ncbi:MAG: hypothetical protein QOD99_3165 [Chthoniobacter sp.]|jgi:hypothetical protein|nr:hypothetical protein [Chthoniobacter sp.]
MKNTIHLITTVTAILTTSAMAQTSEKQVALRWAADMRYVTAFRGNKMNVTASKIGPDQLLTLIDANGGDLADGDDVQIKYVRPDGNITYCWENGDAFARTPKGTDPATHFKIKKTEKGISLQTASGKFIAVPPGTKDLAYADDAAKAVVLEVIENPTVESSEPKPAVSATAPAGGKAAE